jgi:hypothetical protein
MLRIETKTERSEPVQRMWAEALSLCLELLQLPQDGIRVRANSSGWNKEIAGSCEAQWESATFAQLGVAPRKVNVRVKSTLTMRHFVKTLAHELEHARQYMSKELTINKVYRGVDGSGMAYRDQPHEIAARDFEDRFWGIFIAKVAHGAGISISEAAERLEKIDRTW